jgi:hypothetical protein
MKHFIPYSASETASGTASPTPTPTPTPVSPRIAAIAPSSSSPQPVLPPIQLGHSHSGAAMPRSAPVSAVSSATQLAGLCWPRHPGVVFFFGSVPPACPCYNMGGERGYGSAASHDSRSASCCWKCASVVVMRTSWCEITPDTTLQQ